ncbi:ABC transporter G family member 22 [Coccomyxa sp. Obi]|nr:ABC transporter G family member 22 [Coccomyxa sp. Obi]
MELALLLPVLILSLAFAVSVLLYSVEKVAGRRISVFRRKGIHPASAVSRSPGRASISGCPEAQDTDRSREAPTPALEAHLSIGVSVGSYQWSGVGVTVRDKSTGKPKRLLQGCAGTVLPGDLVALIGPSGAGKSTLLDVLAMRLTGGTVAGHITVNGRTITKARFRSISTYVPQEDVFVPTLSVWETLAITTNLRLPQTFSGSDKEALMLESLRSMGLLKVKNSQVGGLLPGGLTVRGISGGEKRRLSIACGCVGAPKIIALDEPTSGLDANAALVVMQCMYRLAGQQRIVISSIHQPRASIWDLFTKVQVLSEGRMLYFGPTCQVTQWFTDKLGYEYDPVVHGNTSEWLSDLISISFSHGPSFFKRSMRSLKDVETAAARFAKEQPTVGLLEANVKPSKGAKEATVAIQVVGAEPSLPEDKKVVAVVEEAFSRSYPTGVWNQYCVLQQRALQAYTRNPANVAGRTLMAIFIALVGGLVFYKHPEGHDGVQQTFSAIFFAALVLALVPFTYMSMFVADRHFFVVDPARPLYNTAVYYVSIMAVNAFVTVINSAVLILILYAMIGLRYTAEAVVLSTVVASLHSLVAVQVLVLCAFLTPNQDLAFVLAVSYDVLSSLLAGIWVYIGNMVGFLKVVSYATFFRYTVNAFLHLQYAERDDGCGLTPTLTPQQAAAVASGHAAAPPNGRQACDGVLSAADMQLSLGGCIGGLVVLLFLLHCASFAALARYTRRA